MKLNMSIRLKIFIIAVCIIVTGQIVYSRINVRSFQESYLETLREKCEKIGLFLKDDVEHVLNLKIPLTKLIKLENTLKEILQAIPELEFIEITDLKGYVLYYADHGSMGRIDPETRISATRNPESIALLKQLGLKPAEIDTVIPVIYLQENDQVGDIIMRLSPNLIISQSREILLDLITVILTSLLITFELMTFFVSYSISFPMRKVVQGVSANTSQMNNVSGESYLFMPELGKVVENLNAYITKYLKAIGPINSARLFFPLIQENLTATIHQQQARAKEILKICGNATRTAIAGLQEALEGFKQRLDIFAVALAGHRDISQHQFQEDEKKPIEMESPFTFIRPMIFLIVMGINLSISFFPMFVDSLYEPLWGLSREIIISLPISVFMFFLAVIMPLSGGWSDRYGWYRTFIVGCIFSIVGLALTAFSSDIMQLMAFRSLTAAGFGMTLMSSQCFVLENTTGKSRAVGITTFVTAFFSGDICGAVIGGMLAHRIGYRNVFIVAALICLLALVSSYLIFKSELAKRSSKTVKTPSLPLKQIFTVLKDKDLFAIIFFQAIPAKMVLVGFLYYLVPLYLKQIGTLQSNIGRVIMCYGVMLVFMGPLFSKYLERERHRRLYVLIGSITTGLALISFYFYTGFIPILIMVILLGLSHTFSVSSQASLVTETEIIQKVGAGVGLGYFRFWERVGNVAGPVFAGFLISRLDFQLAIVIMGAISIGGGLLYMIFSLRGAKPSPVISDPKTDH